MKLNKKMATILGGDVPETEDKPQELVVVEPHEIVTIDNDDLPDMSDLYRKQLQGEKQLEELINFSLGYQQTLFDEISSVDPKYRARYTEVANATMGIALDAIKTKLKVMENQRKLRMDEAKFTSNKPKNGENEGDTTNNFFFGTREEIMAELQKIAKHK